MRRAVLLTAAAILLGFPTVLAFFSGGYFEDPRLVGALVAWAVVLVSALIGPRPLPVRGPGWAAVGGLAFLTAWTAASLWWAPVATTTIDAVQRLLLYLGAFLAAIGLLRLREVGRALEPALAAGIVVVIGYGLAGRVLPGLIELSRSAGAFGRLEQPITYWNGEGALAAIGLVLCARLAGDPARPGVVRAAGAAVCPLLGLGVYLSYSRGAIATAVVGTAILLAAAPTRGQLRGVVVALGGGVIASACSAALPGVASLSGNLSNRESDGTIMIVILVVLMTASALITLRVLPAEAGSLRFSRRLPALAATAVALVVAGLVIGGVGEKGEREPERLRDPSGSRLTSVKSRRYDYWRVGLGAFGREPLLGVGAGGFRYEWLRERPVNEGVREAHSLELGMAVDLGLPGLLGLALMVGGVGVAGRQALAGERPLAAGCCAASVVWLLHASIDWDWEIPAVTLPVLMMAGGLIAASEEQDVSLSSYREGAAGSAA